MLEVEATSGRARDELLHQSIQMAHDLLEYVSLDQALTSGDIGHLQDMLPHLLFHFAGGGSKNYTTEILELLQGLEHEWPDDLWCVCQWLYSGSICILKSDQ
jgi:hypothetical protein